MSKLTKIQGLLEKKSATSETTSTRNQAKEELIGQSTTEEMAAALAEEIKQNHESESDTQEHELEVNSQEEIVPHHNAEEETSNSSEVVKDPETSSVESAVDTSASQQNNEVGKKDESKVSRPPEVISRERAQFIETAVLKELTSKQTIEDTHTRQTYLIRNDLIDRFDKLAKKKEKGFKKRIINELLEAYLDHVGK